MFFHTQFKTFILLIGSIFLLKCRSSTSFQQEINQLKPDERILQAETFFQNNNKKWALYAWNQTKRENLISDRARESYRLLKNWLFSQPILIKKISDIQISTMYLDYDDLWLGTWNGGIYRVGLNTGEHFILEADKPSLIPRVVYRIRKNGNAFWFAMYQGLRFYNYQTGHSNWLQMPGVTGAVSDFLENSEGLFVASLAYGMWLRTAAGDIFPIGEGKFNPTIVSVEYHDDLGLLIGTAQQGVFRWKDGFIEPLKNIEPTFGKLRHVNHIANDGSSIWFASSGEGLFRWDYSRHTAYRISSETLLLRSNRISSLLHRNDWIFIGDDKGGISGYHLKENQWYIWDNGRNLEFSRIDALEYGNGQLFYSTLAGGIHQIHWLKYLLALKQKESNK